MLEILPASHVTSPPWGRVGATALLLHVLGVAVAVNGTAAPLADARPVARDTVQLFVPPPAHPSPARPWAPPTPPALPAMPQLPSEPYLPLGAPEFTLPGLSARTLELAGLAGSTPSAEGGKSGRVPALGPLNLTEVDHPPLLERAFFPRYPEELRRVGVEGWVEVEYVVGKGGQVNSSSIRALASSHPGFVPSALEAIRGARFRPARRSGQPVPVLVRQVIRFRIR